VPARLAQARWATTDQPRAQELLTRLAARRCRGGGLPARQRGLLGDRQALVLGGDGATLPTGASPPGRPTWDGRTQGLCRWAHARLYRDPTATWGDDADRATSFVGQRSCQHWVVPPDHPLPVPGGLAPAHLTACTMGPTRVDRCLKICPAPALPGTVRAVVDDRGRAAQGLDHWVQAKALTPVMALQPRRGEPPAPTGPAPHVNAQGIPLCPAGRPRRRPRLGPGGRRLASHGPVKRPTRRGGRGPWGAQVAEWPRPALGQPQPPMGPGVALRPTEAPRLYPPLPRESATVKARRAQRTGGERANSCKKVASRLGERPGRSATHCLVRLSLVRRLEQAHAWLAEDRQQRGEHTDRLGGLLGAA
jgi:hypothetical protein